MEGGAGLRGVSRMRVKAFLCIITASILGFTIISAIPLGVECIFGDISRREFMAKLDSIEKAEEIGEPLMSSTQSPVIDSGSWMALLWLWALGLLLSLGIYFLARSWMG